MKLCSLFPKYYDVSAIAENLDRSVLDFFARIYQGVFAQHWYENNIVDYAGPEIICPNASFTSSNPTQIPDSSTVLAGCGGGKDSIVAMKMLQEAEIPFASMKKCLEIFCFIQKKHLIKIKR